MTMTKQVQPPESAMPEAGSGILAPTVGVTPAMGSADFSPSQHLKCWTAEQHANYGQRGADADIPDACRNGHARVL